MAQVSLELNAIILQLGNCFRSHQYLNPFNMITGLVEVTPSDSKVMGFNLVTQNGFLKVRFTSNGVGKLREEVVGRV